MQKIIWRALICRKTLLLLMFIICSGVPQTMSLILSAPIKMLATGLWPVYYLCITKKICARLSCLQESGGSTQWTVLLLFEDLSCNSLWAEELDRDHHDFCFVSCMSFARFCYSPFAVLVFALKGTRVFYIPCFSCCIPWE